jgi:hypothetical protein
MASGHVRLRMWTSTESMEERKDRPMFTDFRQQPATIRQQELLAEAAQRRIGRPDRMVGPDRTPAPSLRIGRLLRRLAGPTTA